MLCYILIDLPFYLSTQVSTGRASVPDVAQVPHHSRTHASSHRPPSRLSSTATNPPMLVSPQLPTQMSQQLSMQSPAHISTTVVTLCTQQPPYSAMQYQPYLTTTAGSMARPSRPKSRPQPYTALSRPMVQSATNLDTTQASSSTTVHVATDSPAKRPVSTCTASSTAPPATTHMKRKRAQTSRPAPSSAPTCSPGVASPAYVLAAPTLKIPKRSTPSSTAQSDTAPPPTTAVAQLAPVQAPAAEAVDMVDSTGWFYTLIISFIWHSGHPDPFLLLGCSDFHGIAWHCITLF